MASDNAVSSDNAYEALSEGGDDVRWAYGTGFADPLEGIDTTVPAGTDAADLAAYCLMLGDDALIMSHRLQQWCTDAPELEDEVALANIALDLLGQARLLLSRAAAAEEAANGTGRGPADDGDGDGPQRGEDFYAFFRAEHEFRNVRLAELERGDFGELIARLLVFATWRLAVLRQLTSSRDPVLAAIAAKGVKEVTYHRDYAAQWLIRLGDGTAFPASGPRRGWRRSGRTWRNCSRRTRSSGGWPPPGWPPTRRGCGASSTTCSPRCCRPRRWRCRTCRRGPGWPAAPGVTACTPRPWAYLLAELQSVARADPEATW